jgi:hypothetical protein
VGEGIAALKRELEGLEKMIANEELHISEFEAAIAFRQIRLQNLLAESERLATLIARLNGHV